MIGTSDALGIVIGRTEPDHITFESKRPVALGEYIVVKDTQGRKILGVVESSEIRSDALNDLITNFEQAIESKSVALENIRDKSFKAQVKIIGLLEELKQCKTIIPEIPPFPGTEVYEAIPSELEGIFGPEMHEWIKIGSLLRQPDVNVRINLNKLATRHLAILAMTGMGKSNLVTLLAGSISEIPGTIIIFDYHDEYRGLNIKNLNFIPAQINPRLISSDRLADVLEIRGLADIQKMILNKAFDEDVRQKTGDDFWLTLERNIDNIAADEKRNKISAQRVKDKIREGYRRLGNILQVTLSDPISMIKEGMVNVISMIELNEKQANIAIAFYLEYLLIDRKNARNQSINRHRSSSDLIRFNAPIIVVIEEAHVFIPKNENTETKYFAAKVAREGRKFGMGLIIVSQRPRSIDPNVLSQMGSLAIMKIVQQEDQSQIAATSESLSTKLVQQLPSLNPGESLLVGQWVNIPSFVRIHEVKDRLAGADPNPVLEWTRYKRSKRFTESTNSLIRNGYIEDI